MVSTKRSASGRRMAGHAHQHDDFTRAFAIGIALNVAIVVIELVFGLLGNSMALVADAGHNLSDVLGLIVGWAGAVMARLRLAALHLRAQEGVDPLGADQHLVPADCRGAIAAEAVRRLFHPSSPKRGR